MRWSTAASSLLSHMLGESLKDSALIRNLYDTVCAISSLDGEYLEYGYFGCVLEGALEGYFYSDEVGSLDDLKKAFDVFDKDASKENLKKVGVSGGHYFRERLKPELRS